MKKLSFIFLVTLLAACNKEKGEQLPPPYAHPVMLYKDLQDSVRYRQPQLIDIDNDGLTDFSFGVLLVGDPLLQRDRLQFYAFSRENRNLLNDSQDQSPMLDRYELISLAHPGYTWYELSAIVLAEMIITNQGNHWEGLWKNSKHQFLPVQVERDGKLFHGWIELSFDTVNEQLIIHRTAVSTEEEKAVKAGW